MGRWKDWEMSMKMMSMINKYINCKCGAGKRNVRFIQWCTKGLKRRLRIRKVFLIKK